MEMCLQNGTASQEVSTRKHHHLLDIAVKNAVLFGILSEYSVKTTSRIRSRLFHKSKYLNCTNIYSVDFNLERTLLYEQKFFQNNDTAQPTYRRLSSKGL
jgi:hypothetical protein